VYQLAIEFNIDRRTVSDRLKKAGVEMRLQPPSEEVIAKMITFYQSGSSCANIGKKLRRSPQTVLRFLREGGIEIRKSTAWRELAASHLHE
jgi:intein-encoded DNA endonuclease-like protein